MIQLQLFSQDKVESHSLRLQRRPEFTPRRVVEAGCAAIGTDEALWWLKNNCTIEYIFVPQFWEGGDIPQVTRDWYAEAIGRIGLYMADVWGWQIYHVTISLMRELPVLYLRYKWDYGEGTLSVEHDRKGNLWGDIYEQFANLVLDLLVDPRKI